ncbi:hypothetical protein, partial [Chamaesiphon sp. VAR_48_metabat_403]|uniref:hypothetical protein n=1 Tax=Chamaesiphon sp. VAR_48_metabat_403 TaxID=2964700 RepID=UPI00286DF6AE
MSIPKKGSRKIVVGSETFIWNIRKSRNGKVHYPDECLTVAVEHAQEPRSILVIYTHRLHPESWSPQNSNYIPVQPQDGSGEIRAWRIERKHAIIPVKPADVALWIQQALGIGWQPKESGIPFTVAVADNGLKKCEF